MYPTQITYRNLRSSRELSDHIRDLCEKLGHLHPHIVTCRVAVEQAFIRARKPVPLPYRVDLKVRIPNCEISAPVQEDFELDIALRKSFMLVRRQLREAFSIERERAREHRVFKLKF